MDLWQWLGIAAGGALGSLARTAMNLGLQARYGNRFSYGTVLANIIGCFALGLLMHLGQRGLIPVHVRLPLAAGLLGGFTTFSSFSYETLYYLQQGHWPVALANVVVSVGLGLVAAWAGFSLADFLG